MIVAPLTSMLQRDQFQWTTSATEAIETLKQRLATPPILSLPNFTKPFTIDTKAFGIGIGVVLYQDGKPIAFFSKKLNSKMQQASTCVGGMFAITEAVTKWQQYLLGSYFTIRRVWHRWFKPRNSTNSLLNSSAMISQLIINQDPPIRLLTPYLACTRHLNSAYSLLV